MSDPAPTVAPPDDITLVDDDPMVAEFLARVLRGSARSLTVFHDPREALAHLMRHETRVLMVDTRMPEMDGPELLTRLVAAGRLGGTRVILCSAARSNTCGAPPPELVDLEWLSKDELLDRHTLLARLADGAADMA